MEKDMGGKEWRLLQRHIPVPGVVEAVAFWSAIVLPFIYLPLLLVGLNTVSMQLLFALLITLNAVMIFLGHQHGR